MLRPQIKGLARACFAGPRGVLLSLCVFLSACGGGSGVSTTPDSGGGQKPDPVTVDLAVAYIKRPIPVDEDKNPIYPDLLDPTAFNPGAAVYVKEPKNEELIKEVRTIFEDLHKQESSPIWRIVEKKDAMKIGADPNAAFFLEAAPGFLITEKATGKRLIEKLETNSIQAVCGYLPSRSEMRGVLLAAGKGIRAKSQTEYARITDIVPTIARMLSLELKATRGHTISEIFVQE